MVELRHRWHSEVSACNPSPRKEGGMGRKRALSSAATAASACGVSTPHDQKELAQESTNQLRNQQQALLLSSSSASSTQAGGAPVARQQRGKRVSALINRGVEWESWLVGLQHRLILGFARPLLKDEDGVDGETNTASPAAAPASAGPGPFALTASCAHCSQPHQKRRSSCKRCGGGGGGRRHLYRLVAATADFCERAAFHPGFLSWAYVSRLLAAAAFFLVAAYLNALATMIATHRNPYAMLLDRSGEPLDVHTLPDLGHDLWAFLLKRLGHHTDYIDEHALPDRIVSLAGVVGNLFILCHPQRFKISRRVFTIFGTVLVMRAVSVSVTVLPDASPVCRARFQEADGAMADLFPRAFLEAARFVWAPTSFVTCGDMVFSGHTTCLMMVALTFRKYCRAKHLQTKVIFTRFHLPERLLWVVRRAVYVYVSCGCLVIVGSKLHYTLDVLLAIFICYCTFFGYHNWARHDLLRRTVKMLQWLESEDVRKQDKLAYKMAIRP